MTPHEAEKLIGWLLETSAAIAYGSITLTVTKHDGQVRFIEKTCTEKTQIPHVPGAANG